MSTIFGLQVLFLFYDSKPMYFFSFNGSKFELAPNASHSHQYSSLGSYNGQPFVTGGYQHAVTEYMHLKNSTDDEYNWSVLMEYPFYK